MSMKETSDKKMCKVFADLNSLLNSGLHSDLTILVNGENFKVHKAVLSCRCAVFAAMLSGDFVESQTSVIKMDDIDTGVMKNVLRYIYSGDLDNVPETYEGLLSAADKYGLDELSEVCEEKMASCLSPDNASRYLLLSDRHNSKRLKTTTVNYIRRNEVAVLSSKGWKELKESSSKLIVETLFEGSPTDESSFLSPPDRSKPYEAHFRWCITDFNRTCWNLGDCLYSLPFSCPEMAGVIWKLRVIPVLVAGVNISPLCRAKLAITLIDSQTLPVTAKCTIDVLNGNLEKVTSLQLNRRIFQEQNWEVVFPQVLRLNLDNAQTTLCCSVVVEMSFYSRVCRKMRSLMKF